jgi:hypothetical protein
VEGTKKRRRPRKRWRNAVEEDRNTKGIKKQRGNVRNHWEWRKIYWKLR